MGSTESGPAWCDRATPGPARLLALLAAVIGWMFLVRNAAGLLAPQLLPALHLGPRHLGLFAGLLAVSWSLSGWAVPAGLARLGLRAQLTLACALLAAACAVGAASGNLATFALFQLMAGCAGGPALPLIQQAVAARLDAQRRGQYMGWVQGLGGGLLAAIVGPIAFVPLANTAGWKAALLVLAAGAVVLAFAIAKAPLPRRAGDTRSIQSPAPDNAAQTPRRYASDMSGNSAVCAMVGGLMVGWLVLGTTFFPLCLVADGGLSTGAMSRTMAVVGAGGLFGLLTIPRLSDRFGRRAVLVLGALLGCAAPLALLLPELSLNARQLLIFAGSTAGGTFPLFLAVIPSESGPSARIAQRVGIVQGASELSGGVLAPLLAGWLADSHGLRSAVLLDALAPLAAGIVAIGVRNVRRSG